MFIKCLNLTWMCLCLFAQFKYSHVVQVMWQTLCEVKEALTLKHTLIFIKSNHVYLVPNPDPDVFGPNPNQNRFVCTNVVQHFWRFRVKTSVTPPIILVPLYMTATAIFVPDVKRGATSTNVCLHTWGCSHNKGSLWSYERVGKNNLYGL